MEQEYVSSRGCLLPGGVCSQGCLPWGVLLWEVSALGASAIPACTEAEPPLWTEWQTGTNILPCPKPRLRAVKICALQNFRRSHINKFVLSISGYGYCF